jgi:hypothetical protein
LGLIADVATLTADQATEAALNGAVTTAQAALTAAQAAATAGQSPITTASQAVVADLSNSTLYPGNLAILPDLSPLPGGSFLLYTLAPGTPLGFATQQVAAGQ